MNRFLTTLLLIGSGLAWVLIVAMTNDLLIFLGI